MTKEEVKLSGRDDLPGLLTLALEARRAARPHELIAVRPEGTMAVSVTGPSCSLKCSHCGGRYLAKMVPVADFPSAFLKRRPSSVLLSGGCGPDGAVPLVPYLDLARNVIAQHPGTKLNVHPGVVDDRDAGVIATVADVISFDFTLDEEGIRQAFRGSWHAADYIRSFRSLCAGRAELVPHVLVGLRRGEVGPEYEAVEFLLSESVRRIIFIVFIPTPGTAWEKVPPPEPQLVAELLAWTRVKAPEVDIALGCMRPKGRYREVLDPLAVTAGVDRIVNPHPGAIELAVKMELAVIEKRECCAFA